VGSAGSALPLPRLLQLFGVEFRLDFRVWNCNKAAHKIRELAEITCGILRGSLEVIRHAVLSYGEDAVVCAKCQMGSRRLVTLLEILQVYVERYAAALSHLQSAANRLQQFAQNEEDFWEDSDFTVGLLQWLILLDDTCEKDEFPVTRVPVEEVKRMLEIAFDKKLPYQKLGPHLLTPVVLFNQLERIRETFIAELQTKLFFSLPSNRKKWFESPTRDWEKVIERFPDTVSEIEEMNRCFALSRYPAAVFHSLMVVEAGLIVLGNAIGVTDPKLGWDATSKKLAELMQSGHAKYPSSLPMTFSVCEQINQSVQTMKHAWRNKINHIAGKLFVMRSDFAPDVAEEIIFATRGFMRRLADDLPKQSV
jgi:hypothetical protein